MGLPPTRHATGPGGGLQVVDYRATAGTTKPAAGGVCSVTFEPVAPGLFWLVDRMVVSCTSSSPTTALVYTDQQIPANLQNGTPAGNLDVDDANSPLLVDSTSTLIVAWSGASDGAVGTARIQYRVMRRA